MPNEEGKSISFFYEGVKRSKLFSIFFHFSGPLSSGCRSYVKTTRINVEYSRPVRLAEFDN